MEKNNTKIKAKEFEDFLDSLKQTINELNEVKKILSKEKISIKQMSLQNSMLRGFIEHENLLDEYAEFSKKFMVWLQK